ncbi:hypothetical protein [Polaribacter sp. Asnod1-A03]|uniref:hypothetical protein n=1 Tax=Polaribacter sp. Asnod1-A03 TaxID=3160581 RepID=UPI003870E0D0
MKFTKKALWSILLIGNMCVGQNLLGTLSTFEESARVFNDLKYNVDGIDGHQYYLDDWGTGKIIINDSISAPQSRIQFDMVSGEPIIGNSHKEKKGFILRDKSVTSFVINNRHFVRIPKSSFLENVDRDYFYTPTLTKENYLLIDSRKVLKEPYVLKNSYNDTNQNKRYVTMTTFYILNKDNKYISVKLKEKDILKALVSKKSELKKYIKGNKLNLKKEKDVVKLLSYYHSL